MSGGAAYHVGHLNVAVLKADWESPVVAEFVNALDQVNEIAARADGFVLNIGGEELEAQIAAHDHPLTDNPRIAATLSVWRDAAALDHFVHKTLHGAFLRRKSEWFEDIGKPSYVVWPIPAGHKPDLGEALDKLAELAKYGPTSAAYDLAWSRGQEVAHA